MLQLTDNVLKALVTRPPEDGRANDAVVALLADAWHLPKSSFAVIKGATSRQKTLRVSGDADVVASRIADWVTNRG